MASVYHCRETTERMLLIFKDNMLRSLPGGDIYKRLLRSTASGAASANATRAQQIFRRACIRAGYSEDLKPYSVSEAPLLATESQ